MVSNCSDILDGSFIISLNCGEDNKFVNCSIDFDMSSGDGGLDRSGIPPGRFIPDKREDMSVVGVALLVAEVLLSSSEPPRGIDVANFDDDDDVMKLGRATEVETPHDRSCI